MTIDEAEVESMEEIERRTGEDRRQAVEDEMTGLALRNVLERDVKAALADPAVLSIVAIYLDIVGLGKLNRRFGHKGTDGLIKQAAARLEELMQTGETAYRVGGDEFVVLKLNVVSKGEAHFRALELSRGIHDTNYTAKATFRTMEIARRVIGPKAQWILNDNGTMPAEVRALAGYYWFSKEKQEELSQSEASAFASNPVDLLISNADKAVILAKNGYSSSDLSVYAVPYVESVWVEYEMSEYAVQVAGLGIDRGEIAVCYQPIFSLVDGSITGFEAFPVFDGIIKVPPANYEALFAELTKLGHTDKLWQLLLAEGCRELKRWGKLKLKHQPVISINLDASLVNTATFNTAIQIVLEHGVRPNQVAFEILERQELPKSAKDVMKMFRVAGFGLTIDDLTAGFASPGLLPFFSDCLSGVKFSGELVKPIADDPEYEVIPQLLLAACAQMPNPLAVTAEGIETEAQLDKLKQMGCSFGQGYLLGGKLSPDEATALLRRTNSRRWVVRPLRAFRSGGRFILTGVRYYGKGLIRA